MSAQALTPPDVDRWSLIATDDGLRIEGSPRHGMHIIKQSTGVTLASFYRGPESLDVLAALDTYRAIQEQENASNG